MPTLCTCRCWRNSDKEDKYVLILVSLFRGEFSGNVNKIEEQGIEIMSKIRILQRKRIYSYSMHEQSEGVRNAQRSVNSRSVDVSPMSTQILHLRGVSTCGMRQQHYSKHCFCQYAIRSSCKPTICSVPNAVLNWVATGRRRPGIYINRYSRRNIRIRSMNMF